MTLPFMILWAGKVTLLLALSWLVAFLLRRRSAALRHRVWTLAILGSLALPVLALILPSWRSASLASAAFLTPSAARVSTASAPALPATIVNAALHAPLAARLTDWLFLIWLGGVLLAVLTLLTAILRLAFLAGRARPLFDEACLRDVLRLSRSLGLSGPVRLLESSNPNAMPATWGVFEPRILVPSGFAAWPRERRRAVLAHELSHILRRDWLLQISAESARAVYWFHPLAWIAARRLRRESECASDDAVLNSGVAPCDYAAHLLEIVQTLESPRLSWPAAVAMARPSDFERRMIAMLDLSTNRRRLTRTAGLFTAAAAACLLLPLAALQLGAQASGKFTGTVYDPSGAAVPNATLILTNANARTRDMTASGEAGEFTFTALPAGEYEMLVLKPGFAIFREAHLVLDAGRDFARNVPLTVGDVDERVNVDGGPSANGAKEAHHEAPSRIRVGGSVQAANLVTKLIPIYPYRAKARRVTGVVILEAVIGKEGAPMSLRVMNSQIDPDLAKAAVESVSRWRYRPTLLNGEPIEVVTQVEVHFTLAE